MESGEIRIRIMTPADIALGLRLKEQAGWNQTAADWTRFLDLEPAGCFVAELAGVAVGTTTTCVLGTVGWIAMVLVAPSARHRGIGTCLVERAVDYLEQQGVATIRLDATALGRPVYERLGFASEYELVRLEGVAQPLSAGGPPVVPVGDNDLARLAALDQHVTATDRRRLLARLYAEHPHRAGQVVVGDDVLGYIFYRPGARATHLGPAAASTECAGRAVLAWALTQNTGQPIYVDIPAANHPAHALATNAGLTPQRSFTRMSRGQPVPEQPEQLWASSGPEKG